MKTNTKNNSLLQTLHNLLSPIFSNDKRILAAYLFGSRADGSEHQQSDIDIGIMIDYKYENEFKLDDEIELEISIETQLKTNNIDLVVLNKKPLVLQFRILAPYKVVYSRDDNKRCDMEEYIIRSYHDFLPRLNQINKEYFETLAGD